MISLVRTVLFSVLILPVVSSEALSHTSGGLSAGGFIPGFIHPFGGLDHLLATVAVGAWLARLGRRALLIVPLAVLSALELGFTAGVGGLPVPAEAGISASLLMLAAVLLFDLRPFPMAAAIAAGFFAFFHGHAHGAEMPGFAMPVTYAVGLGAASALLMVMGGVFARFHGLYRDLKRIFPNCQVSGYRNHFEASAKCGSDPGVGTQTSE